MAKTASVKPQLKTKMQNILSQHPKPATAKTAVKAIQPAKKATPAQTRVVARAPAAPVAKAGQLVQRAPAHPRVAAQKKLLPKRALGLAQVDAVADEQSDAADGSLLGTFDPASLQTLLQTKDKLHHLYQAIGEPKEKQVENLAKSYGVEMDDEMENAKAVGSNQVIAHAIADRVLVQLQNGKPEQAVMADLSKTKEALKLAQRAFYDKDPEAIELLQLDESDKSVVDVSDKVFLFDNNNQQSAEDQADKSFVQ